MREILLIILIPTLVCCESQNSEEQENKPNNKSLVKQEAKDSSSSSIVRDTSNSKVPSEFKQLSQAQKTLLTPFDFELFKNKKLKNTGIKISQYDKEDLYKPDYVGDYIYYTSFNGEDPKGVRIISYAKGAMNKDNLKFSLDIEDTLIQIYTRFSDPDLGSLDLALKDTSALIKALGTPNLKIDNNQTFIYYHQNTILVARIVGASIFSINWVRLRKQIHSIEDIPNRFIYNTSVEPI